MSANPLPTIQATLESGWDIRPLKAEKGKILFPLEGRFGELYTLEAIWYQHAADANRGHLVMEHFMPFSVPPKGYMAEIARFVRTVNKIFAGTTFAYRTVRRQFCFCYAGDTAGPYYHGPHEDTQATLWDQINFTQLAFPLCLRFLAGEAVSLELVKLAYIAPASKMRM